jgi:hypothetical protein
MGSLIKCRLVLLLCLLLKGAYSFGQTAEEFFQQKDTQRKYLIEQIAALKIYAGYLEKGYKIAGTGLKTVKDIKNGEFNLHSSFMNSLKTVSPAIRNDVRVAEFLAIQIEIRKAFDNPYLSQLLSPSHQLYIASVREKVLDECNADLDELMLIVTSGKIEMKDDERLKRLEKVYASVKEKAQFAQSFKVQVSLLMRQKENEQKSVTQLMKYYEKE